MKQIHFILAIATLTLFLWACQGNNNSTNTNMPDNTEETTVNVNTPTAAEEKGEATPAIQGKSVEDNTTPAATEAGNVPEKKEKAAAKAPVKEKALTKTTHPPKPPSKAKEETTTPATSTQIKVQPPAHPEKPVVTDEVVKVEEEVKPEIKIETPTPPKPKMADHQAWDALLRKHISGSGKVNYKGFKADAAKLDAYLADLDQKPIQSDWSRKTKMAYWINAYNAFTVKLIVDNYPVSSITKLHGGKPWDVKWIKLGGKTYSLNNIENDILRPQFKDARIHFAVNCAAKSCPPILNRAWTAENLNSNFDKQAKAFINNPTFNKLSADKIEISKIFEWYASDFGSIVDYINKYAAAKVNSGAKVTYMEYNWALNE